MIDLDATVVWGLVARSLGAMFVLAHASLMPQLLPACGTRGVTPIAPKLAMLRANFGFRRFIEEPTLLWLSSSDAMIRALNLVGLLGGAWAICGGPYATIGLALAWLGYLSLADAAGLTFPWDSLLLEAGFLGLFLPSTHALAFVDDASVAAVSAPLPLVALSLQWLPARLMLGFAKVKFIGTKPGDNLYLQSFFVWLPVPNPIGLWLAKAPAWFHRASLVFMFVAEVAGPILVMIPGPARLVGAALLVLLMIGIHATGNWGFFNVAYAALCLAYLDVNAGVTDVIAHRADLFSAAAPLASLENALLLLLIAASVVQLLAFNTWVARSWVHWPILDVMRRRSFWVGPLVDFFRVLVGAKIVNAYGVFPPNAQSPLRLTPIFELSDDDGKTWRPVRYRYVPSAEDSRAPMVAPHHPRIDHAIIYAGGGLSDASLVGGLVGFGLPHMSYLRHSALDRGMQHLIDATASTRVRSLFAQPLPTGKLARVSAYAMVPGTTTRWRMKRVGTMVHASGVDDGVMRRYMSPPELFHPDLVEWKRRSRPMRAIAAARAQNVSIDDAMLALAPELTDARDRFWRELVPLLHAQLDGPALAHPWAGADALREHFSEDEMLAFERVLERYAWVLRIAVEPHREGRAQPALPRMPAFRFALSLSTTIVDAGSSDAVGALVNDPARAVDALVRTSKERHIAVLSLFRPNAVELTAQSWRWSMSGDLLVGRGTLPSVFEYYDILVKLRPRDEEWLPNPTRNADGTWDVGF